ncbi:hypothetical protein DFH06DRAFT_1317416 [Mycena polygramma]|nr:hypothetical protein DFH06DRAFT_1317416 [Mycena polygramma]
MPSRQLPTDVFLLVTVALQVDRLTRPIGFTSVSRVAYSSSLQRAFHASVAPAPLRGEPSCAAGATQLLCELSLWIGSVGVFVSRYELPYARVAPVTPPRVGPVALPHQLQWPPARGPAAEPKALPPTHNISVSSRHVDIVLFLKTVPIRALPLSVIWIEGKD